MVNRKWQGIPFTIIHPKVLPLTITFEIKEEVGRQILEKKLIITIGQLLKLALDLNIYLNTTNQQTTQGEGSDA
jgi:hypothetical protein